MVNYHQQYLELLQSDVNRVVFDKRVSKTFIASHKLAKEFRENGEAFQFADENGSVKGFKIGNKVFIESMSINKE
jgi:hypothetical protein